MLVREASEDDLPAVLTLLRQDAIRERTEPVGITPRQRAAMAELVASPDQQVLVGELAGAVVATCQVGWLRHLTYDGGLICQIESVRVDAGHRGRGLGRELIGTVIEAARQRGCARVQLTANVARTRAHRFYEGLGFRPTHIGMKLPIEEGEDG